MVVPAIRQPRYEPPTSPFRAPRPLDLSIPVNLPIFLDPDEEREILQELAEEIADEWWDQLDEAFPNDDTGVTMPLTAPQRYQKYLELTPVRSDIPLLLMDDYTPLFQAGLLPLPQSPFWAQDFDQMPRQAERDRKDFAKLWARYNQTDGSMAA